MNMKLHEKLAKLPNRMMFLVKMIFVVEYKEIWITFPLSSNLYIIFFIKTL